MGVHHSNFTSPSDYQRIAGGGGHSPVEADETEKLQQLILRVEDLPDADAALNLGSGGGSTGGGYGWGGSKYPGSLPSAFGFGFDLEIIDLPLMRRRSRLLFMRNLYAAGLVRRLVTNEVNTGLVPQAQIMPNIVGLSDSDAALWIDQVEELFSLYSNDPDQFHWHEGEWAMPDFEDELRRGAIIEGDMLVIERINKFGTPSYQLIPGSNIVTPLNTKGLTNKIIDGVEVDSRDRHVAYHVIDWETGEMSRIPARGRRSGRRTAWLVYGSDQRYQKVRGVPLLGLIIQSLKEIDTYRDAEARAAVINSFIAVYMTKEQPGIGSGALGAGATRRENVVVNAGDNNPRQYQSNEYLPGMMLTDLKQGEKPESFDTKRPNVNYATFETAMLSAIAWSNQIPPEVLLMQFSHNYSASKAANAEFSIYLDYIRRKQAAQFHKYVYQTWLLQMVLMGRLRADGLLDAWRDPAQRVIYTAWVNSTWKGAIKPSVDLLKDVRAFSEAVEEGFSDREQATLTVFGGSFRNNVRNLKQQNLLLADANKPIVELEKREREQVSSSDSEQD